MRKDFGPQTWLFPMPVLVIGTYDKNGVPDAMTAAWGGIYDTNEISVCIARSHKTAENLLASRVFTVSSADAEHVAEADFVGIVSANDDPEKMRRAGLHCRKAGMVNAPVFEEFPFTLECELLSYSGDCVVGKIVNVSADERILGADGKIDAERFCPVIFDPVRHTYRKTGEVIGQAFQIGKRQ